MQLYVPALPSPAATTLRNDAEPTPCNCRANVPAPSMLTPSKCTPVTLESMNWMPS
jgi:hypothetical protein